MHIQRCVIMGLMLSVWLPWMARAGVHHDLAPELMGDVEVAFQGPAQKPIERGSNSIIGGNPK